MKNTQFLLYCLFFSVAIVAQDRQRIKGKLLYKNTNVVAANVINNTAQLFTITDSNGEFEIAVAEGDEVIFSSVQYKIRSVLISPEILKRNRLVVSVDENINALKGVVVTPDDVDEFITLKEEAFKGFDYERDKSTRLVNKVADDRQLSNGINFVNVAKLIGRLLSGKTEEERNRLKPSEILPYVFESDFFESDLGLKPDQVVGFLEFVDLRLPSQKLLKQDQQFELIDYLVEASSAYKKTLL